VQKLPTQANPLQQSPLDWHCCPAPGQQTPFTHESEQQSHASVQLPPVPAQQTDRPLLAQLARSLHSVVARASLQQTSRLGSQTWLTGTHASGVLVGVGVEAQTLPTQANPPQQSQASAQFPPVLAQQIDRPFSAQFARSLHSVFARASLQQTSLLGSQIWPTATHESGVLEGVVVAVLVGVLVGVDVAVLVGVLVGVEVAVLVGVGDLHAPLKQS
jgi:hypothetical protein